MNKLLLTIAIVLWNPFVEDISLSKQKKSVELWCKDKEPSFYLLVVKIMILHSLL